MEGEQVFNPSADALAAWRYAQYRHSLAQSARMQPPDTDLPLVVVVFESRHQQRSRFAFIVGRGGDFFQNRLEQRHKVIADVVGRHSGTPFKTDGVDHRKIGLFVACPKFDEKIEGLVERLFRVRVWTIYLVNHNDHTKPKPQRLTQHETGLRHRSFNRVDQQQSAIDHIEHALDLATEIGMTGSIHDVDFHVIPDHGGVFCQNRDAPFAFQCVRVENPLACGVGIPKHFGLLEHSVYKRRFAVVNMRNDSNVTNIGSCLCHCLPLGDCITVLF